MSNTGLLILTNPSKVSKILTVIKQRHVLKTLYIKYIPELKNIPSINSTSYSPSYHLKCISNNNNNYNAIIHFQLIVNIYTLATKFLSKVDVRVLISSAKRNAPIIDTKRPVELVIFDKACSYDDAKIFIQDHLTNSSMSSYNFVSIAPNNDNEHQTDVDDKQTQHEQDSGRMYKNVVLGGTFDRLHNGHKILLTKAVLHCANKVTVGVTDILMIQSKLLWELIEPCERRIDGVRDFLEDINPSISYDVVPINDIYGPTKSDPTLDMIVVSEETQRGAVKVNQVRSENKLNSLDIEIVNLLNDEDNDKCDNEHEETKISSSNYRIRLLGTRLKTPDIAGKPLRPYIIGLTGGIASGKSSVADKLKSLGAGVVECDKIAHELYEPGEKCYKLVVENFGKRVLTPDGRINRKILGDIVFKDANELNKLNLAVWPAILEAAIKHVKDLQAQNKEIIVMEAAVLIQAKWQYICHEIWTCIVPHQEAVKRIVERNKLSADEAESRIQAQPSNVDQVNQATVVFSTLWSHEVTLRQVQKAWDLLKEFLSKHSH